MILKFYSFNFQTFSSMRRVTKTALAIILLSSLANPVFGMDLDPPEQNTKKRGRPDKPDKPRKCARTAQEETKEVTLDEFLYQFQKDFLDYTTEYQAPPVQQQEDWDGFKERLNKYHDYLETRSKNGSIDFYKDCLVINDYHNYFQNPNFMEGKLLFDLPFARSTNNTVIYFETFQKAFIYNRNAQLYAKNHRDKHKALEDLAKLQHELQNAMMSFCSTENLPTATYPLNYFVLLRYFQAALRDDVLSVRKLIDPQAIPKALSVFTPDSFLQSLKEDYAEWRVLVDSKAGMPILMGMDYKTAMSMMQRSQWYFKSEMLYGILPMLEEIHFFETAEQRQLADDLRIAFEEEETDEKTSLEQKERILKLVGDCYFGRLPFDPIQNIELGLLKFESDLPALQCTSKYFENQVKEFRNNVEDLSFEYCPSSHIVKKLSFLFPRLQKLSIAEIFVGKDHKSVITMREGFEGLKTCTTLTSLTLKPCQGHPLSDHNLNFYTVPPLLRSCP